MSDAPHSLSAVKTLFCPSAPAEESGAQVFGVIGGSPEAPRVAYLKEPQPLTPELMALADGLHPEEIYRITNRCAERRCQHYTGSSCSLGASLVRELPAVADRLPACSIRAACRWFQEQGGAACLRCPQVVTHSPQANSPSALPAPAKRRLPVLSPSSS